MRVVFSKFFWARVGFWRPLDQMLIRKVLCEFFRVGAKLLYIVFTRGHYVKILKFGFFVTTTSSSANIQK